VIASESNKYFWFASLFNLNYCQFILITLVIHWKNLLTNAVKFNKDEGSIVATINIKKENTGLSNYLIEFSITDTVMRLLRY